MTTATSARPASSPPSRKTSLYRLRSVDAAENLRDLVAAKYLDRDGFTAQTVEHDGVDGFLVTGTTTPGNADWCAAVSRLTGTAVSEQNHTSFGLLLVRTERAVYALTFGMGFLMIEDGRIDPGFGIEFAVRCLDEGRITKVRKQIMDARGRTDESASTGGEHIRGFGIEQFGEIVSQISGQIDDVELTYCRQRQRAAHITGSDRSLKLQLGTTPERLLHDLKQIELVCERESTVPALDFIAQVRPVDPKSPRIAVLDAHLDHMLGDHRATLALAVPSDCRERYDATESFAIHVSGRTEWHAEFDIDDLRDLVASRPDGERLKALRQGHVTMYADADGRERNSRDLPADHWISAEVTEGPVTYFYLQRRWYEVGAEYLSGIERRIEELLAEQATVSLPPWPAEIDEGDYNDRIAEQNGYVHLDKDMIHTSRFRGGGLEIADALGPGGELICVKKASKTEPLNHLFAQARVAAETLKLDAEARQKFVEKLPDEHPADRRFRNPAVVLGVLLKDGVAVSPKSLFAFAKVQLLHTATSIEGMGGRLQVVSIARP